MTPEHAAMRLGKATASRMGDLMAKTKSGYSTSRNNYLAQLLVERLTGVQAESYTNSAMQWGIDHEAEAIAAYWFKTNDKVTEPDPPFVDHPIIAMAGASPDGYVGDEGLIQVKCPLTATHVDYLLSGGVIPRAYRLQMQFEMACTGRLFCDYVSYDPRMPTEMQLEIQRVQRSPEIIAEIEKEVSLFLQELDANLQALRQRYKIMEAA